MSSTIYEHSLPLSARLKSAFMTGIIVLAVAPMLMITFGVLTWGVLSTLGAPKMAVQALIGAAVAWAFWTTLQVMANYLRWTVTLTENAILWGKGILKITIPIQSLDLVEHVVVDTGSKYIARRVKLVSGRRSYVLEFEDESTAEAFLHHLLDVSGPVIAIDRFGNETVPPELEFDPRTLVARIRWYGTSWRSALLVAVFLLTFGLSDGIQPKPLVLGIGCLVGFAISFWTWIKLRYKLQQVKNGDHLVKRK